MTRRGADEIMALCYLPDGTRLVTGHESGALRVHPGGQRRPVSFATHAGRVSRVFLTPAEQVASASQDGTVCFWDLGGTLVARHTCEGEEPGWGWDGVAAFSDDGMRVATRVLRPMYVYDTVTVWAAGTGEILARLRASYGSWEPRTRELRFSPNGAAIAVSCDFTRDSFSAYPTGDDSASAIQVFSVTTEEERWRVDGDENDPGFCGLAFSPDGVLLAAGCGAEIRCWDVTSGRVRKSAPALCIPFPARVTAFSPSGDRLAAAGRAGVGLWDVATGATIQYWDRPEETYSALAFSPDGRLLAAGGDRGHRLFPLDED